MHMPSHAFYMLSVLMNRYATERKHVMLDEVLKNIHDTSAICILFLQSEVSYVRIILVGKLHLPQLRLKNMLFLQQILNGTRESLRNTISHKSEYPLTPI